MPFASLNGYRPSLRRWTRAFAALWLFGAVLIAPVAVTLLEQINNDAGSTYTKEIPSLLDRDRKAIKLERLSSFVNAIGAARDPRVERRVLLRFQALAQGFDLDDDPGLTDLVARVVVDVRRILAAHAAARRSAAGVGDGTDRDAGRADLDDDGVRAMNEAVGALNSAADDLTTGSALTADRLANRIQQNASWVERGSLAALVVVVASGVAVLWFFHRHVLAPIRVAVSALELVRGSEGAPVELPRSLFFELDVIGRAVEQYARFAAELRTANLALLRLSSQDGLTGVTNRRGFDAALGNACREAGADVGSRSLLLVDIDHFKSLNDRFGHLAGDRCLRQVADALQSACAPWGGLVSRYGGEEFAVLVPNLDREGVGTLAEHVRGSVEGVELDVGAGQPSLKVTVSVGGCWIAAGEGCSPERAVTLADQALYQAKRDGRNRVRVAEPALSARVDVRSAA